MRASLLIAAAFTAALAAPALAASRTYDVGAFDAVSVSAGVTAIVTVGGDQHVEAEANSDSVLNRLTVQVRGSTLEIGVEWNLLGWVFNLGQPREITVRIAAPAIISAEASSGSAVDVEGMNGDRLTLEASSGASVDARGLNGTGTLIVNASSGANLKAAGSCNAIEAESSSGAMLDADGLTCLSGRAEASSGGHANVRTTQAIEAEASSGGSVTVRGKPTSVKVDTSSGGTVDLAD